MTTDRTLLRTPPPGGVIKGPHTKPHGGRCWFCSWHPVFDAGVYSYQQCKKCGRRRAVRSGARVMSPLDRQWLMGGARLDESRLQPPPAPADRR